MTDVAIYEEGHGHEEGCDENQDQISLFLRTLGLTQEGAEYSQSDINRACNTLMFRYHPDRGGEKSAVDLARATIKAQKISEAKTSLLDYMDREKLSHVTFHRIAARRIVAFDVVFPLGSRSDVEIAASAQLTAENIAASDRTSDSVILITRAYILSSPNSVERFRKLMALLKTSFVDEDGATYETRHLILQDINLAKGLFQEVIVGDVLMPGHPLASEIGKELQGEYKEMMNMVLNIADPLSSYPPSFAAGVASRRKAEHNAEEAEGAPPAKRVRPARECDGRNPYARMAASSTTAAL